MVHTILYRAVDALDVFAIITLAIILIVHFSASMSVENLCQQYLTVRVYPHFRYLCVF